MTTKGTPKRRKEDREIPKVEKNGKWTFVSIAAGGMIVALLDQVIVKDVEINPMVYGIMAGVAIGAYPQIVGKIFKNGNGK